LDTKEMRIIKCDHCGGAPECAKVCPTGAIQYGPISSATTFERHSKVVSYLREIEHSAETQSSGGGS
jgi:Fe-S-cluster-containing dehydrogenase component